MKLEEAIEIVLREARSNGIGGLADDQTHEAASVVEDFFVNNVFDGTEDDLIITQGDKKLKEMLED